MTQDDLEIQSYVGEQPLSPGDSEQIPGKEIGFNND